MYLYFHSKLHINWLNYHMQMHNVHGEQVYINVVTHLAFELQQHNVFEF